jgi:hypothetical protein
MMQNILRDLEQGLSEVPILDIHTHLVGGNLSARGLHDILLYHMVISDLYAAGCPNGNRLTEYPSWPNQAEANERLQEAIPYLPYINNTSMYWMLRRILVDLYQWDDPITENNWRKLDSTIRERSSDQSWQYSILDKANIHRSCTEIARRRSGVDDSRLQYALEWGFFTRSQWGEYDTALYELERCWGRQPESPFPVRGGGRQPGQYVIKQIADIHSAITSYVDTIPYSQIISMATHISTDIDFRSVDGKEIQCALDRRQHAGIEERNIYASYVNEAFLTALEPHGDSIVFQFSFGAEPLPHETGSRLNQETIRQLAEMIARHPKIRFQCLLANRHTNQSLCTLARELPNLSLAGYWWHNFFPDSIQQVMSERLDMLPVNKQIGYFSDAYCVEWSYGKAIMVKKILAKVLTDRVKRGQYNLDEALSIARAILYDSPQSLLNIKPRVKDNDTGS